jgi:hypothetical protein
MSATGAYRPRAEVVFGPLSNGPPGVRGWSPGAGHPLEQRIRLLRLTTPSQARRDAGLAAIAAVSVAAFAGAWLTQPPARAPEPLKITLFDLVPPDKADVGLIAAADRVEASRAHP